MKIKLPGTDMEIGGEDYNALAKFINFAIPGVVDKSGIKQDEVKFKRWENAQRLFMKAKIITDNYGKILNEPPLKISMSLLENASLESEESLQDKWANLLANSLTGEKNITASYIEILKELSSTEVKILDKIYNDGKSKGGIITDILFSTESLVEIMSLNMEDGRLIVDNLYRLRLAEAPALQGMTMGGFNPVGRTNDFFHLTTLGYKFIESCRFTE